MSSTAVAVSGLKGRIEEDTQQLLQSLTGRITIDGVQKYCHWEITGCTEEEFRKLIAEPNSLLKNGRYGGKTSAILNSSHTETVNGKQTVNNSSITQVNYALEPEIYQFGPNFMKMSTPGAMPRFSSTELMTLSMKAFYLFIASTPFEDKPIIKVFARKDLETNFMAIMSKQKRVPIPASVPSAALSNASSPLSLLPPSAPTPASSAATLIPSSATATVGAVNSMLDQLQSSAMSLLGKDDPTISILDDIKKGFSLLSKAQSTSTVPITSFNASWGNAIYRTPLNPPSSPHSATSSAAAASSATILPSVPAPLDDPYANFDDMLKGFKVDSHGESSAASAPSTASKSKAKATITELVDPPAHPTATAAAVTVSPTATVLTPPVTPANTPMPKAITPMLNAKLDGEKAASPKSTKPTPVSSAAADKATSSAASPSSISKPVVASTVGSAASSAATAPTSAADAVERLRARRKK